MGVACGYKRGRLIVMVGAQVVRSFAPTLGDIESPWPPFYQIAGSEHAGLAIGDQGRRGQGAIRQDTQTHGDQKITTKREGL